ncbi:MAG: flavodoxin family protein [Thermoplasmata archaeon]|nr:flavodoxin family protein [Thermoplasmata archaeon]
MGKIVAVACSPKSNGSSSRITDAFLDGAMGLSTNFITLYRLSKFRSIQDCRRNMACKTSGKCVINDDMAKVLEDIADADCVVFSTPIYFDGPCALYKLLEDRMFSFLDNDMNSVLKPGKKALLIVTSYYPETRLKEVAEGLANTLRKFGFEIMDVITYCDQMGEEPVEKNQDVLHEAKQMGLRMRNTPTV